MNDAEYQAIENARHESRTMLTNALLCLIFTAGVMALALYMVTT